MVRLDGSMGEGGGQVLRSALTLSLLTGTPFRLERVREGRPRPGLAPQHRTAVAAAAAVGSARVEGAVVGSREVAFAPGTVQPGRYAFAVGTAGSASLVFQAVALPLALAGAPSAVRVGGGTHVPWSPCFDYLEGQWLPTLRRVGFDLDVHLARAGFHPRGGGELRAAIRPVAAGSLRPLRLVERGQLREVRVYSAVAGLSPDVGERQARRARERLEVLGAPVTVRTVRLSGPSPGTVVVVRAVHADGGCCATALGERGKPAERVADEAVDRVLAFEAAPGAVDPYLADQLLHPLALAPGRSEFTTTRVTRHLTTNAAVLGSFLPGVEVEVAGEEGAPGRVRIGGAGSG